MQLASQLRRRWPREAAEPPPYDAVLEAAEKSRAALVELCQRWRKRKREAGGTARLNETLLGIFETSELRS